ncbi:MAG: MFS transporter [Firmicutes bacterium]|nr:MFS transporter [Bacillota bacterium]
MAEKERARNFALLWAAVFLDTVGYGIIIPVVPGYAVRLGASPEDVGVIFAAYSVTLLLGSLPAGRVADRYGRRAPVVLGMAGLALATLAFALARSYWTLLLSRLLQGLAAAATWTAGLAMIADMYPERQGEKLGLAMTAMGVGSLAGPVLGGGLAHAMGYAAPFYFLGACSALVALAMAFLLTETLPAAGGKAGEHRHLSANALWGLTVILVGSAVVGVLEPLLPLDMEARFRAHEGLVGLVFGLSTLSMLVAQPVAGWLADGRPVKPLIAAGLFTTALALPWLATARTVWYVAALMGVLGVTLSFVFAPCYPMINRSFGASGNAVSGTAFGMANVSYSLGYVVGPLAGGALAEVWGLFRILGLSALVLAGLGAVFAWRVRERGRARRTTPRAGTRPGGAVAGPE